LYLNKIKPVYPTEQAWPLPAMLKEFVPQFILTISQGSRRVDETRVKAVSGLRPIPLVQGTQVYESTGHFYRSEWFEQDQGSWCCARRGRSFTYQQLERLFCWCANQP